MSRIILRKCLDKVTAFDFGADLRDYLKRHRLQDQKVVPILNNIIDLLSEYDFSSAEVVLIPSLPGRHSITDSRKWGHWRLKQVLMDAVKATTTSDIRIAGPSSSRSSSSSSYGNSSGDSFSGSSSGQLLDDDGFPPVRQGVGKGVKSGGNNTTVSTTTNSSICANSVSNSSGSSSTVRSSISSSSGCGSNASNVNNISSSSSSRSSSSSSANRSDRGRAAAALEGTIVMQSSSLAKTTKKWVEELSGSMSMTQMTRRKQSSGEPLNP